VLYEMIAGTPPFVGPTAASIIARHTMDRVPSLAIVRENVPDELEDTVLKALAKVPADRFRTAGELADALRTPQGATYTRRVAAAREATQAGYAFGRPKPNARRRATLIAAVALPLLVLGGWGVWRATHTVKPAALGDTGPDPRHLAVMYFSDDSREKDLGYLADGLSEALIDQLSTVAGLNVVSKNGAAMFRGKDVPADSAAKVLGVGTLVDGSVEHEGKNVRVSIRLKDASGADFKRASFDEPLGDPAAMQKELAQRVSEVLRQRLGEEVQLRETRRSSSNPNAWALLQRGEKLRKDAEVTAKADDSVNAARQFDQADSLFASAVALDPSWTDPILGRAMVAYRRSRYTRDNLAIQKYAAAGLEQTDRALAIDPKDAQALELRGTLKYWTHVNGLEPDLKKDSVLVASAEKDLRAALAIDPNRAYAWYVLSFLRFDLTDTEDGLIAARNAYEKDLYLTEAPDVLLRLYSGYFSIEKFIDAAHFCLDGHKRFPDNPRFVTCQLFLGAAGGQRLTATEAWALVDTLRTLAPKRDLPYLEREAKIVTAGVLARAGLADSARHVLLAARTTDTQIDPEHELLGEEAWIRTIIGDKDEALKLLQRALAYNPAHKAYMARNSNWQWRELRDDPRFKQLVGAP